MNFEDSASVDARVRVLVCKGSGAGRGPNGFEGQAVRIERQHHVFPFDRPLYEQHVESAHQALGMPHKQLPPVPLVLLPTVARESCSKTLI
jgi:hypothetical protein